MKRWEYSQLLIRQKSMDLVDIIYAITKSFPKEEVFGLVSQLRRAACSIPVNIAEGNARKTNKDFAHFLHIAHWSCVEVETWTLIAMRQKYLSSDIKDAVLSQVTEIRRMICWLSDSLE